MIIGVADDVDGLIEQHQSIERCLVQIHMPRMDRDELELIVTKGLTKSDMTIAKDALQEISGISKGLPHYTHLLALHSGRKAIESGVNDVEKQHVQQATSAAIENTQQSIRNALHKAILSTKKNTNYEKVLLACAMAETDEWGYFAPVDVCAPVSIVMKKPYPLESFARHLHMFCNADRGPVLKKMGVQHRFKFRFANALMQPYILMRGLNDETIARADLHFERAHDDEQKTLFRR